MVPQKTLMVSHDLLVPEVDKVAHVRTLKLRAGVALCVLGVQLLWADSSQTPHFSWAWPHMAK